MAGVPRGDGDGDPYGVVDGDRRQVHHRGDLQADHRDDHRADHRDDHRADHRHQEPTRAVPHPSVGDDPLGADRCDDPDDHWVVVRLVARQCLAVAESAYPTPRPVVRVAVESACQMLKVAAWHRGAEHGKPR
ncbi:MAG: hypothetical protein VYC13_03770 [Actinomycetota bacterium]|nr:hypothetical protein [Actinomycetota bacterium]